MQTNISEEDYQSLVAENKELKETITSLESRLDWFMRQVFEKKNEKFYPPNDANILPLFDTEELSPNPKPQETEVPKHKRRKRGKTENLGDNVDSGLRFDDGVEVLRMIEDMNV